MRHLANVNKEITESQLEPKWPSQTIQTKNEQQLISAKIINGFTIAILCQWTKETQIGHRRSEMEASACTLPKP